MEIKINGENKKINHAVKISEVISKIGLSPEKIVVEHNFKIIPRQEWQKIALQEGDNLEIVSFVGGG